MPQQEEATPAENELIDHPFKNLAQSSSLLIARGFIMAAFQFAFKRAVLAQKDKTLSESYGVMGILDGLAFAWIFSGIHIGTAKTAQLHAEESDPKKIGTVYRQVVILGALLLIPIVALCFVAPNLLRLTGQSEQFVRDSETYRWYALLAYFLDMLYRTQARTTIGVSHAEYPLIADSVESLLDGFFTYAFVNGKWGFPETGVEGCAIAYALSAAITAVGHAVAVQLRHDFKKYELFRMHFKDALFMPEFKSVVIGGLHLAIIGTVTYISQMITTLLLGLSDNKSALVGLQAAEAVDYLTVLPEQGLSEAANVEVGKLFKNKSPLFRTVGNVTFLLSLAFSALVCASLFLLINSIASIFMSPQNNSAEDFWIVKIFLLLQAIKGVVDSTNHAGNGVLCGCDKTKEPFLLSTGFVLILNSMLTLSAHFLFSAGPAVIFGIPLVGYALNSAGILNCWRKTTIETTSNTCIELSQVSSQSGNSFLVSMPELSRDDGAAQSVASPANQ